VELPPGAASIKAGDLTLEMILAGMLRVLGEGAEADFPELSPQRLDYYRRFVLTVRPGIYGEFTEAAILKAKNGDFPLALEILRGIEGLFPGEPRVLLNKALVLEEKARQASAASGGYGDGERAGGDDPSAEAASALSEAASAYGKVLALKPPFPDALFNGGCFFMESGDFPQALECLSNFLALTEGEGDSESDDDRASEKRSRAAALVREIEREALGDYSLQAAYGLVRKGREEEALLQAKAFLEKRPGVWRGWFVLGWALRRLGRWADGAASFQKAIELGGASAASRNELAICLMETGRLPEARRQLEKALEEEPENIKIISNLGVLARRSGNADEAAAFFRIVLDMSPEDPVAQAFFSAAG